MTRYGQIGWRMVAVVAFVGTAALAVKLTRVPIRAGAAYAHPRVVTNGTRVAERAGHPGPARRPRLPDDALSWL